MDHAVQVKPVSTNVTDIAIYIIMYNKKKNITLILSSNCKYTSLTANTPQASSPGHSPPQLDFMWY